MKFLDWDYFINNILGNGSWLWLSFIVFGILTFFSAKTMVNFITAISLRVKIGAAIVGGVIVSIITSIPELMTAIFAGSSSLPGALTIGINNEFGSNLITSLGVAVGDFFMFKKIMRNGLSKSNIIIAIISTIVTVFFLVSFAWDPLYIPAIHMSLAPMITMAFYIGYTIYSIKDKEEVEDTNDTEKDKMLKWKMWLLLVVFIFSSALLGFFAYIQAGLAERMGSPDGYNLGQSLAGGLLLSMSTTLPETTSFIFLARKGLMNAAVLGYTGSHVFNISLTFITDLVNQGSTNPESLVNYGFNNYPIRWELLAVIAGYLVAISLILGNFYIKKHLINSVVIHTLRINKVMSIDNIEAKVQKKILLHHSHKKAKHYTKESVKIMSIFSRFIFPSLIVIIFITTFVLGFIISHT